MGQVQQVGSNKKEFKANLFYYQQFFALGTVKTRNGPKHFIDLIDKSSDCVGINVNMNGSWELEANIIRLNPNCRFFGFSTSGVSHRRSKNSVFEEAVLSYDGRIPRPDDSNCKLLKFDGCLTIF